MRSPFVLLTGFAPFGARRRNESGAAVRAVRLGAHRAGIRRLVLPVSWARAFPLLRDALSDPALRAVVLCGEAARRLDVSVEARARNRCAPILDEDRRRPRSDRLSPTGPGERASTWPAGSVVAALRRVGIRAAVSRDAGGYLCNAVLYRALGHPTVRARGLPVTFVHLPIPGHGAREGTTPERLALAVGAVVAEACRRFLPAVPASADRPRRRRATAASGRSRVPRAPQPRNADRSRRAARALTPRRRG